MKKNIILSLSLFFISILISSCKKDDDDDVMDDCNTFEWEYEGESDPDAWGNCFVNCSGQVQSPVNIKEAVLDGGLTALDTQYDNVPIELVNNGHTIEFRYKAGSVLKLNGDDYKLLQFHFHTGSEHTVDGLQYPMEVHLVHQNTTTESLAVIGILFEEGNENAFLANFNDNLPANANDHYSSTDMVNVESLMPANGGYYTYSGSLTTPPCSEIVTWFVLKTPVEASEAQIRNMHDIMHDNYRPIQPLHGREIKEFN